MTVALTPTIAVAMTGAIAKGYPSDVEYAQVLALTWGSAQHVKTRRVRML